MLVDFDGTIVLRDTAQLALERFCDSEWTRIDEEFEKGEITLEESLRLEFAMLKVPEQAIIEEVSRVTEFRPNFGRLVDYCKSHSLPLTVVSAGLDFCIRHFLDRDEWLKFMQIYAPTSEYSEDGYKVTFPRKLLSVSSNFKDDLVRRERKRGTHVYFVGDGIGDLFAAKESDSAFAIKGSKLAELCREQSIPHAEIDDFSEVIDELNLQTGQR